MKKETFLTLSFAIKYPTLNNCKYIWYLVENINKFEWISLEYGFREYENYTIKKQIRYSLNDKNDIIERLDNFDNFQNELK